MASGNSNGMGIPDDADDAEADDAEADDADADADDDDDDEVDGEDELADTDGDMDDFMNEGNGQDAQEEETSREANENAHANTHTNAHAHANTNGAVDERENATEPIAVNEIVKNWEICKYCLSSLCSIIQNCTAACTLNRYRILLEELLLHTYHQGILKRVVEWQFAQS